MIDQEKVVRKIVGSNLPETDRERKLVSALLKVMRQGDYKAIRQYPQLALEGIFEDSLLFMHLDKETKKYLRKAADMIQTHIMSLAKYSSPGSFSDPADYDRVMELFRAL